MPCSSCTQCDASIGSALVSVCSHALAWHHNALRASRRAAGRGDGRCGRVVGAQQRPNSSVGRWPLPHSDSPLEYQCGKQWPCASCEGLCSRPQGLHGGSAPGRRLALGAQACVVLGATGWEEARARRRFRLATSRPRRVPFVERRDSEHSQGLRRCRGVALGYGLRRGVSVCGSAQPKRGDLSRRLCGRGRALGMAFGRCPLSLCTSLCSGD